MKTKVEVEKEKKKVILENKRDYINFLFGLSIAIISLVIVIFIKNISVQTIVNKKAGDIYNLCDNLERNSFYEFDYEEIASAIVKIVNKNDVYARYVNSTILPNEEKRADGMIYDYGLKYYVTESNKSYIVQELTTNSSKESGIKVEDEIIKINDIPIDLTGYEQLTLQEKYELVYKYKNPLLEKTKYTVLRDNVELDIYIKTEIKENEIVYAEKIDDVGYIRITTFIEKTKTLFIEEFEKMTDIKALIIDLRSNGGGSVKPTIEIADYLLPKGIITTFKTNNYEKSYTSDDKSIDIPIYVLVNENTASASEILASAIRSLSNGKIIGTETYGKTVGQGRYMLNNIAKGTYVSFTDSKINTHGQENGKKIIPDNIIENDIDFNFNKIDLEKDKQLKFTLNLINK